MTVRTTALTGCLLLLGVLFAFGEADARPAASLSGRYRLGAYLSDGGEFTPENTSVQSGYIISETKNNTLLVKFVQYDEDFAVIKEFEYQELPRSPSGGYSFYDELDGLVNIQPNADGELVYTYQPTCDCIGLQVQMLEKLE